MKKTFLCCTEKEAVVEDREEEGVELDNRVREFKDSKVVQGVHEEVEVGGSEDLDAKG